MKLIFLIERQTAFQFFSSLINYGLRLGHQIDLWYDFGQTYKVPLIENCPFSKSKHKNLNFDKYDGLDGLRTKLKEKHLAFDYIVDLHPLRIDGDNELLAKISGKWCFIQHGHDSFSTIWNSNKCR